MLVNFYSHRPDETQSAKTYALREFMVYVETKVLDRGERQGQDRLALSQLTSAAASAFFSFNLDRSSICYEGRNISYPELGADGRLTPGCPHLLLAVPAAHLLEQVVDEVQSEGKQVTPLEIHLRSFRPSDGVK